MQTCSGVEMTLGLWDSLSLTPATLLNTRVGYSGSPARSPRSCGMAWNDKQPARRGEQGAEGWSAASGISACNFLTMAHPSSSFYFCSTDSQSPLQTWVFMFKSQNPFPFTTLHETPRTTKNAWFGGFLSVTRLWRLLQQKPENHLVPLQSYRFLQRDKKIVMQTWISFKNLGLQLPGVTRETKLPLGT